MTSSFIMVFNVGRGLAVLTILPNKNAIIYDLGCSTNFSPIDFIDSNLLSKFLKVDSYRISQIILSHPHGDHITEINKLTNGLLPRLITCPHDKSSDEKIDWSRITNKPTDSLYTDKYKELIKDRCLPLQTAKFTGSHPELTNVEYGVYYLRPPEVNKIHGKNKDQEYSNGISIVYYYKHGKNSILIPGDITPEVLSELLSGKGEKRYTIFSEWYYDRQWNLYTLTQPSLKELLTDNDLTVLVAPHHGLKSCYCQELYDTMKGNKPDLVVVSERRRTNGCTGDIHPNYQGETGARGMPVEIDDKEEETRYCITTKNSHHILIEFKEDGTTKVRMKKDPKDLFNYIEIAMDDIPVNSNYGRSSSRI